MDYFPVADLKQRYGIGKQAEINRRKHLGMVPQKVDGVYVIDEEQLGLLDRLDEFLSSKPGVKMTDFTDGYTGSTGTNGASVSGRPAVMDATLVESSSDLVVQEEEEEPTNIVELVETIARAITPPNPIAHWEKLAWLADNQIIVSTSEVQALVGTKPKGDRWSRGSFTFERSGKLGTQVAWKVLKITN